MINISNRQTVPQIFFDKIHIGGYDDLEKKYKNGELLKLINEKKV
jgi:glutaredoxin